MKSKKNKKFDRIIFTEDKLRIVKHYKGEGFLDIKVKKYSFSGDGEFIDIVIELYEEFRTVINEVKVFGNKLFSGEKILKILNIDKNIPLNYYYLSGKRIEIIDEYAAIGYIYAEVNYEILDKESKYRKILYVNINEDKKAYIKEINFDSIPLSVRNICYKENYLNNGDVFTPSAIYELQNNILATGNFKMLSFEALGVEEQSESLIVMFKGSEKRSKWIAGGILYQFADKGKLSAGWGHDNVFNNGEHLSLVSNLLLDVKMNNWINAVLSYKVPYLLNTKLIYLFETEFNRERNELFRNYEFSVKTGIGKKIGFFSIYNNYKYKISILDTNVSNIPIRIQNATTNSAILGLHYDSRNNPFYPLNGFKHYIEFEYAGGILQGYNNYTKYLVEISYYHTLLSRITNAFKIYYGVIIPYGISVNRDISIDEQFTLGGYSSVRGIMQDSLGPVNEIGTRSGKMYLGGNFESRMLIYKIVGLSYFVDAGLLYNEMRSINARNIVFTPGFGIFVKTIIGPVRFDLSRPINVSGPIQFYLNLGNSF